MINNTVRVDHPQLKPNLFHVLIGSVTAVAILLTNFQLISILDLTAFASIGFFNFIFVFLLFPLKGTLKRKITLLVAGNIVGSIWHVLITALEAALFFFTAGNFEIIFLVVAPLANFMWIVCMWSISLSALAPNERRTMIWERN